MARNITIKIAGLSRDEVRAIDRAAKAFDRTRSHWARSVLLAAAVARGGGDGQGLPAAKLGPSAAIQVIDEAGPVPESAWDRLPGGMSNPIDAPPARRRPLVRSFDPDAT